jgi:hypothetical protein
VGLLIKTSQDGKFLLNKAVVNGQGKIPDFFRPMEPIALAGLNSSMLVCQ